MEISGELRPVIVRLLSNMASAKEIQQYLKRFSQVDAKRFAVVKVGGAILRERARRPGVLAGLPAAASG